MIYALSIARGGEVIRRVEGLVDMEEDEEQGYCGLGRR